MQQILNINMKMLAIPG